MKKFITFILSIIIILMIVDYILLDNKIYNYISDIYYINKYSDLNNKLINSNNGNVYKNYSNFAYTTDNFFPNNKQDLLNIYYTSLNNGLDKFSYYCPKSYTTCLDDIKSISNESENFTYLNHLIHPFNSFKTIHSSYEDGLVEIEIEKKYSDSDIDRINNRLEEIIYELNIDSYNSDTEKIRAFHDYLINNNKYDTNKESGNSLYDSDIALGPFFEGYAVCSGYSDAMAIFLNRIGIENVKVVTDKHAWNAVKLDNNWYHLDLTWDDPVASTDLLLDTYFLITSDKLLRLNDGEHNYSTEIYNFIY